MNTRHITLRLILCALILPFATVIGEHQIFSAQRGEVPECSVVGRLDIRPFDSAIFHNKRMLRVWLPPGYDSAEHRTERYPVLYLNDGQDLFDACTSIFNREEWRADETATELIGSGKVRPLIIIGIDNAGKADRPKEYLPFPDDTLTPAVPVVRGEDYPVFLLDEVMPFINHEYRTKPDPADTGLGGSSYGAGIALYTVMARPGHFGKLLLESPSLYAHDNYLLRKAREFTRWPETIFIGVGSINEPVDDVHQLGSILRSHRLRSKRLLIVIEPGAAHNEKAWAERFPQALQFLYSRNPTGSP